MFQHFGEGCLLHEFESCASFSDVQRCCERICGDRCGLSHKLKEWLYRKLRLLWQLQACDERLEARIRADGVEPR